MKHLTILLVLLLAVSLATSGCTNTTADPAPTPAPTATPTAAKITAKYTSGDVVQVDPSDPNYSEYAALLVVDVGEIYYTCEVVVRESPTSAWMIYPDNRVTSHRADLELGFPHRMDRVDASTLATWTSAPTQTPTLTPKPTPKTDTTTIGEKNAVEKAKSYLRVMAFSREGLIDQLEFEGFSHTEAVYGADHVGADWNEQAAKKAESYLRIMAFSRSGLIDQLEFEGFTHSQAEYGVAAVGY
ncbi:Ltp family lipoprotein [Methanoculleus sp.]|uniref:Ltp family lipoprotein n=1 Tax=Methanoculleus sp. TaxID=90427 RepID=UPI001BD39E84|nr:Ltp family lipoprotein [Methanoculleus sp.]